jgi:hypothetical protein
MVELVKEIIKEQHMDKSNLLMTLIFLVMVKLELRSYKIGRGFWTVFRRFFFIWTAINFPKSCKSLGLFWVLEKFFWFIDWVQVSRLVALGIIGFLWLDWFGIGFSFIFAVFLDISPFSIEFLSYCPLANWFLNFPPFFKNHVALMKFS